MLLLRSCPRCSGDLYDTADIYGTYFECLQCGFYLDTESFLPSLAATNRSTRHTWSHDLDHNNAGGRGK